MGYGPEDVRLYRLSVFATPDQMGPSIGLATWERWGYSVDNVRRSALRAAMVEFPEHVDHLEIVVNGVGR